VQSESGLIERIPARASKLVLVLCLLVTGTLGAQAPAGFRGSVPEGKATAETLSLSLDDAIARGLRHNLGILLSSASNAAASGQRLEQLQSLLPRVDASASANVLQTNLQAQGLRVPGFPAVLGPFGYSDIRGTLNWQIVNVNSLQNYLASRHNFAASQLSLEDARELVILTVGNAYLLVIADESRVESTMAQVATSKLSLDQAEANHQAGTAPLLDELRARVDYQTQQQAEIVARNQLEKDKLALARAIGLPLDQKIALADSAPYSALDAVEVQAAIQQALSQRRDLKALKEQAIAAGNERKAATADRLPVVKAEGDYGYIGINLNNSHGTGDASASLSVPVFAELLLRGEARIAQSQLDTKRDQLADAQAQVEADVRDALLDIQSAQKQVEVAHSNVELATEALTESRERYKAGVSDNLSVSQALQSLAQANDQYVSSLYQHNLAKLSLARALGVASNYRQYIGGK
jgi:outer membrane protein TolC